MSSTIKTIVPYLILFIGLFILFMIPKFAYASGVLLLVGIVMQIERIWPEKWGAEKDDNC